jgi:hypothetical protein
VEPFAVVHAQGPDVSATLAELERKLHELERELGATAPAPPPSAPPEPPARAPAPAVAASPSFSSDDDAGRLVADARRRLGALSDEIDDLLRFREDLERLAHQLEGDHERLLGRFGVPAPTPTPTSGPVTAAAPVELGAQERAAHFSGTVVVDAGPFGDIARLGAFEQALAGMDGVEDVYVSAFEDRRALIEVRLAGPVALAALLPAALPFRAAVAIAGPARIAVHLQAEA